LYQASVYLYNGAVADRPDVYEIMKNPDRKIEPAFKHEAAFKHCVRKGGSFKKLLLAGGDDGPRASASSGDNAQPVDIAADDSAQAPNRRPVGRNRALKRLRESKEDDDGCLTNL
jgi:hypothetical protein